MHAEVRRWMDNVNMENVPDTAPLADDSEPILRVAINPGGSLVRDVREAPDTDKWPASAWRLQQLIEQGLTNREIAERYGVALPTVTQRLYRLGIKRTKAQRDAAIRRGVNKRKQNEKMPMPAVPMTVDEALEPVEAASTADTQAAILAAVTDLARQIPSAGAEDAAIYSRTVETLVRVYRMLGAQEETG